MLRIFKRFLLLSLPYCSLVAAEEESILEILESESSPQSAPIPAGTLLNGSYILPEVQVIGEYIEQEEQPITIGVAGELSSTEIEESLLRFAGASSSTLEGIELEQNLRATLGETLASQPGVSASAYSPAVSRPIIRGFEGNRVLTLLDGLNTFDLSQNSPDHGILIEPLFAKAIDIHRGPSSLLYGNTAIGGVVNTRTRFIPDVGDEDLLDFRGLIGFESQGNAWQEANAITVQKGQIAITASQSQRQSNDISIPGTARTALYDEVFQPRLLIPGQGEVPIPNPTGTLPNSAFESETASVGIRIGSEDHLSFGLTYGRFSTDYGIPFFFSGDSTDFFGTTDISADLSRADAHLSYVPPSNLGPFNRIQFRFGVGDYQQQEIFVGEGRDEGISFLETAFDRQTTEARFELYNGSSESALEGIIGAQYLADRLISDRLLIPPPQNVRLDSTLRNEGLGIFINQKLRFGNWTLEAGSRTETTTTSLEEPGNPAFIVEDTATSNALSLTYDQEDFYFLDKVQFSLSGSLTSRLPTSTERNALWENAALGRFIIGGDLDGVPLNAEESQGIEFVISGQQGASEFSATTYYYDFSNYIFLEDQFLSFSPTAVFVEAPALFWGFEAEWIQHLIQEKDRTLDLKIIADLARSENQDTDQPIPRTPAARLGGSLRYQSPHWDFFLEANHYFAVTEDDITPFQELPTEAYTLINAGFSYRPRNDPGNLQLSIRFNNLLDADARSHTSFRKDTSPQPGFGTSIDLRYQF